MNDKYEECLKSILAFIDADNDTTITYLDFPTIDSKKLLIGKLIPILRGHFQPVDDAEIERIARTATANFFDTEEATFDWIRNPPDLYKAFIVALKKLTSTKSQTIDEARIREIAERLWNEISSYDLHLFDQHELLGLPAEEWGGGIANSDVSDNAVTSIHIKATDRIEQALRELAGGE